MKTSVRPIPTPEEAAAIAAALGADSNPGEAGDGYGDLKRQRWRLAGLMGGPPPKRLPKDGSLWSYSSWEGMV
ncbi:hypothetical protein [Rubrobacter indicoceani]|uniref:hypothetical protein n=1 Tax=Rubrobacter indicoceani TaxID=2051957 RepID=UPI000E5BEC1C|nr:hypothetical protein [Rubrobacter indicoceani]